MERDRKSLEKLRVNNTRFKMLFLKIKQREYLLIKAFCCEYSPRSCVLRVIFQNLYTDFLAKKKKKRFIELQNRLLNYLEKISNKITLNSTKKKKDTKTKRVKIDNIDQRTFFYFPVHRKFFILLLHSIYMYIECYSSKKQSSKIKKFSAMKQYHRHF